MSPVRVFAPGKLFVIGEYAVLEGGRALVVALDAGIRCTLDVGGESWWIAAPDLGLDLPLEAALLDPRARALAAAVEAGRREFPVAAPARLRVEGNQAATRRKCGLGGSAASVVGILAALAAASGEDLEAEAFRGRLFALAASVHREHQGGRGSGADIAASVYGGWLDYSLAEGGARVARPALPSGLGLSVVWSGIPSDTARSLAAPGGGVEAALRRALRPVLEAFWEAVAARDRSGILGAISLYGDRLNELAACSASRGSDRVAELVAAARTAGAASKPSGASGGDCAVALGFSPQVLAEARARWGRCGAEVLDLYVDERGVRRENL